MLRHFPEPGNQLNEPLKHIIKRTGRDALVCVIKTGRQIVVAVEAPDNLDNPDGLLLLRAHSNREEHQDCRLENHERCVQKRDRPAAVIVEDHQRHVAKGCTAQLQARQRQMMNGNGACRDHHRQPVPINDHQSQGGKDVKMHFNAPHLSLDHDGREQHQADCKQR